MALALSLGRARSRLTGVAARALLAGSHAAKGGAGRQIRSTISPSFFSPGHFAPTSTPHSRAAHTVVMVVVHDHPELGPLYEERLAKAMKNQIALLDQELLPHGSDLSVESAEDKPDPNLKAARDAARRKDVLRKNSHQRLLKDVHSCVKRLVAGHAPPRLQLAFGQLASIQEVVKALKSESDDSRKRLEDEKLWIFVFRDRCLEKLPKPVRDWYESVHEIWGHARNLFSMVVLVVLLSSYSPAVLFGMALMAHDKYVKDKKDELLQLAKDYEEQSLKMKAEGPVTALYIWTCVKNKNMSVWSCVRRRFVKPSGDGVPPAAGVAPPATSKVTKEQGSAQVSPPPPPPQAGQEVTKEHGSGQVSAPPPQAGQEVTKERGSASVSPAPPQAGQEVTQDEGSAPVSPAPPQAGQEVKEEGSAPVSPPPATSKEAIKKSGQA